MVMTAECKQIVDYMKKAGFYELFVKRLLQYDHRINRNKTLKGRKELLVELLGALGTNTLSSTFLWSETPEGSVFWNHQDTELRTAFFDVPLKYKKVAKHD